MNRAAILSNTTILFLWALIFIAVLYGLWFLKLSEDTRKLTVTGLHATANVTKIYNLDLLDGKAGRFLEYRFKPMDRAALITSSEVEHIDAYRLDQEILISYPAAYPTQAELNDALQSRYKRAQLRMSSAFATALFALLLIYLIRWHEKHLPAPVRAPAGPTPSSH